MNSPGRKPKDDSLLFSDSSFFCNFNETEIEKAANLANTSHANKSANSSNILEVSALCCDEEILGFDKLTGRTWIYPTNYPVRDYQFNIIRATILKNTLVSLPTGLGKTFIAAVIMYNFYRWYPLGKIIFTAPTRPLVAQQIDACYNIVAIPRGDTVEMTGNMQVTARKLHWKSKRVFFATPQVIYNDLKSGICPAEAIRCLVFDEAHRARGNYAYCQIVSTLNEMGHKTYRVLALSATPGSKVEDVINVVKNLQIAHLELRTENCIDVMRYSHTKKINTVVINIGPQLTQLRNNYIEILDTYARRLKQLNILPNNLGNLSKGRIVMLYKEFQTKERGARHPQHNYIMKDFTLLIALYHGLELLVKHGSRVFLNFFDEHPEKAWIQSDDRLTALLERLRDDLGINPLALDRSILPDGTFPEMPKDICFGHPKFDKLREIMFQHFREAKRKGQETKAIVFCEYRESVNLVHCLLLQLQPLIVPQMFVGQGASGKDGKTIVSQKQQLRVMRSFREGSCNVLVATCVAEEGLDVGSVDLILCFDISTRSPVRLVQRCGRTGRERGGHVYILVTEGREHQTLMDCMRQRDNLNKRVLQSKEVENNLYKLNPRMIPRDFTPECQKMYITVAKTDSKEIKNKGQRDLRTMFGEKSTGPRKSCQDEYLTKEDFDALYKDGFTDDVYFEESKEYWKMNKAEIIESSIIEDKKPKINLTSWLEWQRTKRDTMNIEHSENTNILVDMLKFADAKRFNIPSSQDLDINTQQISTQALQLSPVIKPKPNVTKKKTSVKQKLVFAKSPIKKSGDIRALFSTATRSTKDYTKLINDLELDNSENIPTALIDLLVDLNIANSKNKPQCLTCEYLFDCTLLNQNNCKDCYNKGKEILDEQYLNKDNNIDIDPSFSDCDMFIEDYKTIEDSFNGAEIYQPYIKEVVAKSEHPNESGIQVKANTSKNFDLDLEFEGLESDFEDNSESGKHDKNFDLGNIEDIFNESNSPIDVSVVEKERSSEIKDTSNPKEALGFFGLESIDDLFAESNDDFESSNQKAELRKNSNKDTIGMKDNGSVNNREQPPIEKDKYNNNSDDIIFVSITNNQKALNIDKNLQLSPSLLSGLQKCANITSPIICSQKNNISLSTKNQLKTSTPSSSEASHKPPQFKPKALFTKDTEFPKEIVDLANCLDWATFEEPMNDNALLETQIEHTDTDDAQQADVLSIAQILERVKENWRKEDAEKGIKESCKSYPYNVNEIDSEDHTSTDSEISIFSDIDRPVSPIILTQSQRKSTSNAEVVDEIPTSPIILTQSERKSSSVVKVVDKIVKSPIILTKIDENILNPVASTSKSDQNVEKKESVIIFDSDDSNETIIYDLKENTEHDSKLTAKNEGTLQRKRKLSAFVEDTISDSPYFSKRHKTDLDEIKDTVTIQDKLKTLFKKALSQPTKLISTVEISPIKEIKQDSIQTKLKSSLSLNKKDKTGFPPNTENTFIQEELKPDSQKENHNPRQFLFEEDVNKNDKSPEKNYKLTIESLQMFRRDNKNSVLSQNNGFNSLAKFQRANNHTEDINSDDDFVIKPKKCHLPNRRKPDDSHFGSTSNVVNHKFRKKKKADCSFLDLEASISDDSDVQSGDEHSDDSIGSIVDFICDEVEPDQSSMMAHYVQSIKSPVKGQFKIPALPPKRVPEIFSQAIDPDDAYEMDSFCVDSNVGLTQIADVTELELAERRLKQKKRKRKKKPPESPPHEVSKESVDSPIVIRKNRNVNRISSGSESDGD